MAKGRGKTVWSTKHFPHLIYIHIALEKVHHIQNFSKRTIKEKEQNTAFENTVTLSLYHSWIWKWMLELNKYCTINASKQRKPAWLIKYEPFSLECWKFQRASVYLKVSEWKHLITKHMRMSKTQNRNKAWVLAVIQLKVMQIQNSAFAFWTNRLVTQQSRIADQNLLVLFYVSPCLTNSRLFLYTLHSRTQFCSESGICRVARQKINGIIYTYVGKFVETSTKRDCMTVLVMNSKMSPVRCSLRKRFIASLRNSHTSTTIFFFFCFVPTVSTGHKDNIIQMMR